MNIDTIWFC